MVGHRLFKCAVACLAVPALIAGAALAGSAGAKAPELTLLKDTTWTPLMKDSALPALAPIRGDATKGAYTAYLKLPAGFESPMHSHTDEYWAVLLQGRMTHWASDGGSEVSSKRLAVGDLTFMPSKSSHVSKCYPGEDCIMVITQKGKFDFIPTPAPPAGH